MEKYKEKIDKNMQKHYSINFLISELETIKEIDRDLEIINKKIYCEYFKTKDFKTKVYHKQISSCINIFPNND